MKYLFIFWESNGGKWRVIYFIGCSLKIWYSDTFDREAIQIGQIETGIFVYAETGSTSTFGPIAGVRISPDDEHVYFKNELSGASRFAVFHIQNLVH
jgi:hypothetical protein